MEVAATAAGRTKQVAEELSAPQAEQDGKLVRAVLDGRMSAYGELYDRYVRLIHVICFDVTADLNDAQDLVHETFLRAHRRLSQLRRPERFGAWLVAIARSVSRDWRRRRARDRHRYVGLDPQGRDKADPRPADACADLPPDQRTVRQLNRALRSLPEKHRLAVHLFYLEHQPVEHARGLLGLSRSGFYHVLENTRKRLRRLLRQYEEVEP